MSRWSQCLVNEGPVASNCSVNSMHNDVVSIIHLSKEIYVATGGSGKLISMVQTAELLGNSSFKFCVRRP